MVAQSHPPPIGLTTVKMQRLVLAGRQAGQVNIAPASEVVVKTIQREALLWNQRQHVGDFDRHANEIGSWPNFRGDPHVIIHVEITRLALLGEKHEIFDGAEKGDDVGHFCSPYPVRDLPDLLYPGRPRELALVRDAHLRVDASDRRPEGVSGVVSELGVGVDDEHHVPAVFADKIEQDLRGDRVRRHRAQEVVDLVQRRTRRAVADHGHLEHAHQIHYRLHDMAVAARDDRDQRGICRAAGMLHAAFVRF